MLLSGVLHMIFPYPFAPMNESPSQLQHLRASLRDIFQDHSGAYMSLTGEELRQWLLQAWGSWAEGPQVVDMILPHGSHKQHAKDYDLESVIHLCSEAFREAKTGASHNLQSS